MNGNKMEINRLNTELEHKMVTKARFSMAVEREKVDNKTNYIDAVISVCNVMQVDPSECKSLLSSSLISKIESDAFEMRALKTKTLKLPF
jgi:hypothetical protein